ncbi:aminodeoxychorismate lyase [Paenibacillus eucommiae]|uniref:4-amino-4-deoxychorismate lyase n=1 Tax=Paenibacillus eucommiae TaxID=1355755 RepID=A0ABS4J8G7_9BACL|nr:aminodeoxychorismate lyase [Paenibacillus eucommiae]MBP1996147.1 4-amino-4-deoxychorismate lyase [Paenibacillus eucommiae]
MKISVNGSIYEEQEAVVSVYDHGFLYGLGLFETFRTYGGEPFLLSEHLARLAEGCEELGIEFQTSEPYVRQLATRLLQENHLEDAYFRFSVSAGVDLLGLPATSYKNPTEIVYVKALPKRDESAYLKGKPLQLLKLRRNTPEGPYRLKSFHYMNNILAKRELQSYGWAAGAEGLMLTEQGFIAEGIVSNLFFIKNNSCCTPSLDTGILPGITRAFLLKLAEQSDFHSKQGLFTWEDLLAADEIFFVNSIQEIVPVVKLFTPDGESIQVGDGVPGECTRKLMQLYQNSTGSGL